MKKLLLLALLIFGGYKLYPQVFGHADRGPVDADGTPITQLFVGPGCGAVCAGVEDVLRESNVHYEVIDITTPGGKKYDIERYPLTRVATHRVLGNSAHEIRGVLAQVYGDEVLPPGERRVMRSHFDETGQPLVVLYGTSWCGYCKRERAYLSAHNIAFVDLDVESSREAKLAYDTLQGGGYPLVYVGYRRFDGYREREILDAVAAIKQG